MKKSTTTHRLQHFTGQRATCECGFSVVSWSQANAIRDIKRHTEHVALIDSAAVGDFATYCIGSDRYAVEVIARTAKTFTTRTASVLHADPSYERGQGKTFTVLPDESGRVQKFSLRADWFIRSVGSNSGILALGMVDDYRDPSF